MKITEAGVLITKDDNFPGKVTKAWFSKVDYLKVKYIKDGIAEVRGYDLSNVIRHDFFFHSPNDDIIHTVHTNILGKVVVLGSWDTACDPGTFYTGFPAFFCVLGDETKTDEPVDREFLAPPPETGAEFAERLYPFLHDAARAYLHQHIPTAEVTGNPRSLHTTTRHTASKERSDTTANAFRLPIGLAARELDCHCHGKDYIFEKPVLEQLIRDIHTQFTKDDAWWEHHYGHNVRAWKGLHDKRLIAFQRPGRDEVDMLYDIDKGLRGGVEGIPDAHVEKLGEKEFGQLATDWFSAALYGPRDHITKRPLIIQEKT